MSEIFKKIPIIMRAVEAVKKDRKNQQQGYQFRGIDDMYNALHDLFAANGVFIVPEVISSRREERVNTKGTLLIWTLVDAKFTFFAEDGSSISVTMVGEAMDSGDKGSNKAMSAALKYTVMQMLLIPTEDPKDTENETHELKAPPLPAIPDKALSSAIERIGKGEADLYNKVLSTYSLTPAQRTQLDEANSNQKAA